MTGTWSIKKLTDPQNAYEISRYFNFPTNHLYGLRRSSSSSLSAASFISDCIRVQTGFHPNIPVSLNKSKVYFFTDKEIH